jgi:hypothetical protein
MSRRWDKKELSEQWSLSPDERQLLYNRTDRGRLGWPKDPRVSISNQCLTLAPQTLSSYAEPLGIRTRKRFEDRTDDPPPSTFCRRGSTKCAFPSNE